MIRHIVMYKFSPEAEGRNRTENLAIAKELGAKMEKIPQLRGFQCGIVAEGSAETNYDVVLICDIDDLDALAEYKKNPAHRAFGTHCHAVSEKRAAIDFEM